MPVLLFCLPLLVFFTLVFTQSVNPGIGLSLSLIVKLLFNLLCQIHLPTLLLPSFGFGRITGPVRFIEGFEPLCPLCVEDGRGRGRGDE